MKVKKIPMRKCVGCGENIEKNSLIRIVKDKENNIFVDKTGKANGRGVYLHKSEECFNRAFKNKELERSLKSKISKEIYDELIKILE